MTELLPGPTAMNDLPQRGFTWEELAKARAAEIKRLTEQARGMADVAMKNGEALLLEEAKVRELRDENAELERQLQRWITRMRELEDKVARIRSIVGA